MIRYQKLLPPIKIKNIPRFARAPTRFTSQRLTLTSRLSRQTSRSISHANEQVLSIAKKKTLIKWITQSSTLGVPITLAFTRELAEELRRSRFPLSSISTSLPPLGRNWLDRFRKRAPTLSTVFSRSIDTSRLEAFNYATVLAFFDALTDLFIENSYPSDGIFNVDETGFALGTTLSSKVLVGKTVTSLMGKSVRWGSRSR